jgi:hypothetical protein
MTIWAIQAKGVSGSTMMLRCKKQFSQPFLMKIAEFKRHIAKLHSAIGTYPNQSIRTARHLHL